VRLSFQVNPSGPDAVAPAPPAEDFSSEMGSIVDSDLTRPESDPHRRRPGLEPSPLDQLNNPDTTPQDDVRLLALLFSDYSSVFKRVPLGMHTEIVAALKGDNPRSISYIPDGHPAVNARGEIEDRWDRAYFFHVISRNAVEIISAGPDGELFTGDDIRDVPPHASVEPELTMHP
jgi:hypothetical protein